MALISARNLTVFFGERSLLDRSNLQIQAGERIGLVGRNGEGKSSLLQVLAGELIPDEGEVVREPGLRVSLLPQQVPQGLSGTVGSVIRSGTGGRSPASHRIDRISSILRLDGAQEFSTLSGGQKRRALLGRALAAEPDLLLLDEPTNHLDLDNIRWLENFLERFSGSLLFITHDRTFLQKLATRIVELDRGKLTSWDCDYPTYLSRKEAFLENEEKKWAQFDKNLAKEEEWIRQGLKARRTRNEGRVRALQQLRAERARRRERIGGANISIQEAGRSGARVIVAEKLGFDYGGPPIVKDLSTTIYRGDKVGLVGPNGCGKTTLLNLLLGNLPPSQGTVKHGLALEVSHFDQQRETLDDTKSVAENVELGSDFLSVDGKKRHILSYLQDFLFSPERAKERVSSLSGGERSRLLLARLFIRPANLLVLDEPTNDLDAETLELLEARLLDFKGTVLVVSHDRSFLDNLCSSTLVFEGEGVVREFVGGYSDWRRTMDDRASVEVPPRKVTKRGVGKGVKRSAGEGGEELPPLSYMEKKEWENLPARIEALEEELASLHKEMSAPDFFQGDPEKIRAATARSTALPAAIEEAFDRWAELDRRMSG
ncbi:MAG: ATP-binding cassette domain-containing protein [Gemmatimonadota bacterium]